MDILKYVLKPNINKVLSRFTEKCSSCGKERRYSYIESYINDGYICSECEKRLKLLTIPQRYAFSQVAKYFDMNISDFKKSLENNVVLKRAALTLLEGISRFGINMPQPMGSPFFAIVSITQKCNLKCSFCYNEEYKQNNKNYDMDIFLVKKVIDQLSDSGCLGIGLNGGEPTLRSDFCDIIKYANNRNLIPLVATNATIIDKKYAKQMKDYGLKYAQVSLDGKKETHDKLRGKEGTYEKTIEGIKNLVYQGVYVTVAMVVTKQNISDVEHVFNVSKNLGASKFEVLDYQTLGNGKDDIDLDMLERDKLAELLCMLWKNVIDKNEKISILYKNPQFIRIFDKFFTNVEKIDMMGVSYPSIARKNFSYKKRFTDGIFSIQDPFSPFCTCCEAGLYGVFIDIDGTVTPCPYMPLPIGNIFEKDIHEIWHNSDVLNNLRNRGNLKGNCGKCKYNRFCGGCRARSYNTTGDYMASDPKCTIS